MLRTCQFALWQALMPSAGNALHDQPWLLAATGGFLVLICWQLAAALLSAARSPQKNSPALTGSDAQQYPEKSRKPGLQVAVGACCCGLDDWDHPNAQQLMMHQEPLACSSDVAEHQDQAMHVASQVVSTAADTAATLHIGCSTNGSPCATMSAGIGSACQSSLRPLQQGGCSLCRSPAVHPSGRPRQCNSPCALVLRANTRNRLAAAAAVTSPKLHAPAEAGITSGVCDMSQAAAGADVQSIEQAAATSMQEPCTGRLKADACCADLSCPSAAVIGASNMTFEHQPNMTVPAASSDDNSSAPGAAADPQTGAQLSASVAAAVDAVSSNACFAAVALSAASGEHTVPRAAGAEVPHDAQEAASAANSSTPAKHGKERHVSFAPLPPSKELWLQQLRAMPPEAKARFLRKLHLVRRKVWCMWRQRRQQQQQLPQPAQRLGLKRDWQQAVTESSSEEDEWDAFVSPLKKGHASKLQLQGNSGGTGGFWYPTGVGDGCDARQQLVAMQPMVLG